MVTTRALIFCLIAIPVFSQDESERDRAKKYLQDEASSGLFAPCGNRKENIERYGPENPYVQLSPKDFKTIAQWGRLARSEPREMFGHQYLACSTMADIAILHGRGIHRLKQTEFDELRAELLKMLKARDSNICGHALKGLAAIGDRFDAADIERFLKDENPRVRMFAKEAMAAIDDREKKALKALQAKKEAAEEAP